ncbi:MFS transporter [Azohydromonas lata]|uniref:MFS transporter n=1 Tax=Azohydromonas lata TaxID=45677 RepID=UPI000835F5FC|nr:MFS transporter [Azohydromonas lata]
MSTIHTAHASPPAAAAGRPAEGLPASLILLLGAGAGFAAASLYYAQPLLGLLADDLHVDAGAMGGVPTLTQLGYAAGLALLAPLGDRYDRRRIILVKAVLLVLALLMAASASSLPALLAASLAIGLSATVAQDFVPAAATLAPPAQRGRAVGTVMTGLLLGILLSRVAAGVVAEQWGWRTVFVAASLSVAAIAVVARLRLPRFEPTTQLSYLALLGTLPALWRRHRALRLAAVAQGLLSVGFSAFWSTLAVMLHGAPFHLGSSAAGAFGIAGAAGALAAPLAGRIADRRGPEVVTRLGAGLAALSFAAMFVLPWLPVPLALALLCATAVGFDMGVQGSLIGHQSIVYGLEPAARSRLNAVLFVVIFLGMASGAALGAALFAAFGWMGVTVLSTASALGALAVRVLGARRG